MVNSLNGSACRALLAVALFLLAPVQFAYSGGAPLVDVSATKTVDDVRKHIGDIVTYTVVLTNNGTVAQTDNPGDEFTDVLPPEVTLVSAVADSGTATATVGTNTVTWDGSINPLGGTVTITITATVNPVPLGTVVSNQGSVSFDSDGDGTNDTTVSTDDPTVGGANDTTDFTVFGALVTATKSVSGNFTPNSLATYTITLTNSGNADTNDNAGAEFLDTISTDLVYNGATATSGTVNVQIGATTTVIWNGAIPAGGSVTITIQGKIKMGTETDLVSNQGSFSYDANESGSNNTSGVTDDPGLPGATDPTDFTVIDRIFADGFEGL